MLKHNTSWFKKVYIACGKIDLRLGVDGLATLIQSQFGMNAMQEQVLFLFCEIQKDRIKAFQMKRKYQNFPMYRKSVCGFFVDIVSTKVVENNMVYQRCK